MPRGLLGTKLGMTRIFKEDGQWIPVTLLQVGPCTVIQRKTQQTDGYDAVQLGYGDKSEKRCTKPLQGHFAKSGASPKKVLREFRVDASSELKTGDELRVDMFAEGEHVDVAATSKGKGYAGVIKRHGHGGGPGGHGSHFHRAPGSIGMSADPSKVHKGTKLPGQMGNVRVTAQNIEVIKVDPDKNLLAVLGAIPGANGSLVEVKKTVKATAQ